MRYPHRQGFTLIELLLVIAIISILAAIVIIAINPARQIAQANNAQRSSNVNTILNGVNQYMIDNRGSIPSTIPSVTSSPVCITGVTSATAGEIACVNLAVLTNSQLYLTSMPFDPSSPNTTSTWYYIVKSTSSNPRITVSAPSAELSASITVTR